MQKQGINARALIGGYAKWMQEQQKKK